MPQIQILNEIKKKLKLNLWCSAVNDIHELSKIWQVIKFCTHTLTVYYGSALVILQRFPMKIFFVFCGFRSIRYNVIYQFVSLQWKHLLHNKAWIFYIRSKWLTELPSNYHSLNIMRTGMVYICQWKNNLTGIKMSTQCHTGVSWTTRK